jgi:two-component system response regulator YesN
MMETCRNTLDEVLRQGKYGLTVVNRTGEIIVIFNFKDQKYDEAFAIELLNVAMANLVQALGTPSLQAIAGLGLAYPDLYHLSQSYMQARKCLELHFFDQQSKTIAYSINNSLIATTEKKWIHVMPKESAKLIEQVINGQPERIVHLLDDVFARFEDLMVTPDMIRDYCVFVCNLLIASVASLEKEIIFKAADRNFKSDIFVIATRQALKSYLTDYFLLINRLMRENTNESGNRDLVERIKKYILDNYREDISLEKLSQLFFVSPSYLSHLFKLTTGESYSDFLKMTRLSSAKQLLESQPGLKVYEVCYLVGYKEYKYFSIQFKSTFGISPTSIRKEKRCNV